MTELKILLSLLTIIIFPSLSSSFLSNVLIQHRTHFDCRTSKSTHILIDNDGKSSACSDNTHISTRFGTKRRIFSQPPLLSSSQSFRENIIDKNPSLKELPINDILDSIQSSLKSKSNLLLQASPGAGKTTIVPLLLALATATKERMEKKNIILVEPRRVATRSAAQRMSSILNEPVGQTVGYIIRGETKTSKSKTQITVMTDGVLLNKLRDDPELSGVDIVIFDEFHERGVGSDTALSLCRDVQCNYRSEDEDGNSDLKLVVMSATLLGDDHDNNFKKEEEKEEEMSTGAKLLRVLGGPSNCNILQSSGRQYPITFQHCKRGSPPHGLLQNDSKLLVKSMSDAIEEGLQLAPSKGDVLAFLPGAKEIRKVVQELKRRNGNSDVDILPLYGALPKQDQDLAIGRNNHESSSSTSSRRRVIVSSPIAEASLTIQGVTCVVDSGLRREPRFDANTGLPRLITVPCSKDSAIQRAGRAGRTCNGVCIRLYNEAELNRFQNHAMPEICSTDLVPTALLLTDWRCSSAEEIINDIPFVDPPPKDGTEKAYQMLIDLEALESYDTLGVGGKQVPRYRVTSHGRTLVKFPTHPRFASAIAKAMEGGSVVHLAAAVISVAILEEELAGIIGSGGRRESNIANEVRNILRYETENLSFVGRKILQFASRIGSKAHDAVMEVFKDKSLSLGVVKSVGSALLPGFIDLVAQYKGDASYSSSTYMLSLGRSARLDGIKDAGDYIVVIDTSSGDDGISRIRSYIPIDVDHLHQVATEKDEVYTVESRGYEVRARRVVRVGSLELSSSPIQGASSEDVTKVLLQTIVSLGGVNRALIHNQSKKYKNTLNELRGRIRLAAKLSQSSRWPDCFSALDSADDKTATSLEEELLIDVVEPWLSAAGSLKNVNIYDILLSSLSPDQVVYLDKFFPSKIKAPDGSNIPLSYSTEIPTASAKLQQFFGSSTPVDVGEPGNNTPVSLTLLSPSGKTLAQTIDLPFFWRETYPMVRAEMRGRYPKHPWPEDPVNAIPTRLTKKQIAAKGGQQDSKLDKRKEKSAQRRKKKR